MLTWWWHANRDYLNGDWINISSRVTFGLWWWVIVSKQSITRCSWWMYFFLMGQPVCSLSDDIIHLDWKVICQTPTPHDFDHFSVFLPFRIVNWMLVLLPPHLYFWWHAYFISDEFFLFTNHQRASVLSNEKTDMYFLHICIDEAAILEKYIWE